MLAWKTIRWQTHHQAREVEAATLSLRLNYIANEMSTDYHVPHGIKGKKKRAGTWITQKLNFHQRLLDKTFSLTKVVQSIPIKIIGASSITMFKIQVMLPIQDVAANIDTTVFRRISFASH